MASSARRFAWKLGRKLYCWGRLDSRNDPAINGEYDLLEQVMALARRPIVLLDVGANRGEWTRRAVSLARARNLELTVHAFEPLSGTRALLEQAVRSLPEVKVEAVALSNSPGTASCYFQRSGAGTSSLHPVSGSQTEAVPLTTRR